jgi:predicted nuclease with RNAse H fold
MTDYILGLDPGGKSNFGWALVERTGALPKTLTACATHSGNVNDAKQTLQDAANALSPGDNIVAVGIDAPLGYDAESDRRIDKEIRKKIPLSRDKSTVLSTNSLIGSCLAQGQVAGLSIHTSRTKAPWKRVKVISESHPKAMRLIQSAYTTNHSSSHNCHICDAALAALSAWAAYDASLKRLKSSPIGWRNWHKITVGGKRLRPEFMIVPNHEYWLPF